MSDATAFWIIGAGAGELRGEALPALEADHVRVRMICSGVSRGTERLVLHGRVPASEQARMRCPFQAGAFPWPVKYGYGAVGRIEGGPRDGERVFALHPHQDRFVVPGDAAMRIPDAVPDARATLAANMETAINALWDAELLRAERVVVIGAGVLGLLVALMARQEVEQAVHVVDPDSARCALARELGLQAAAAADGEFDAIFHTSGHPDGLATALSIAAFEGRILEMSWFGDRSVTLPLGGAFHARRLRIISSQVGHVARVRRAWITRGQRLALALEELSDPVFDRLLGPRIAFSDLPRELPGLLDGTPNPPQIVVTY
ncbi:MAG: zinc-binding alcohol dehydrogenase [Alphaproteobacteria bacterium]|nr:zinc-binding alcohol dehydrogenase [Alphaproteobacteria bacterium]